MRSDRYGVREAEPLDRVTAEQPRLTTQIGRLSMKNPVMVASGTFGYGPEYDGLVDMSRLGAVVVKGISPWAHHGNETPRTVEVTSGLINAIGLQNPGFEGFCEKYLPFWERVDVPLIVNIWGRTLQDYGDVAGMFEQVPRVDALELNISCPNIKEGGIAFGTKLEMAREVVSLVREKTTKPLITKLSPNVSDIAAFARAVEGAGSDAISLINSMPAMKIDIKRRRPVLANVTGGLTGPCIRPIAVKLVWEAAQAVRIPIIGMGGIEKLEDALEFFMAGARAVAVGTANFYDPSFAPGLPGMIADYLSREGLPSMDAIVGAALPSRA